MKNRAVDWTALLLRVVVGLIFIPHGFAKVFGTGGAAAFAQDIPSYGLPRFLGYAAAYSEMFGAILLIVGLLTRLDAFLLACTMAVAAFIVQFPDVLHDPQRSGNLLFAALHAMELPLILLAANIALMLLGPGRFSMDEALKLEERVMRRKGNASLSGK